MAFISSFVSFIAFIVTLFYWLTPKRPKNFPPGPRGLPLIGNILQLGPKGYKWAVENRKKYGDIIGLHSGFTPIIFLNKVEDIREAFNKPEYSGRGFNPLLDSHPADLNAGLLMSNGSVWNEHRRFTLRTLRDFGFGKRSLEGIIQDEVADLIDKFKSDQGQPISTSTIFNISTINVIWSIIAGERFSLVDPKLMELINILDDVNRTSFEGIQILFFLYPSLAIFKNKYPFLFPQTRDKFRKKLFDFFRQTVEEHRSTRQNGSPPRDFIDAYLEETEKNKDNPSSSFKPGDDDFRLLVTLFDLFGAGGDTTSTTLSWSLFILAYHPEIQQKMYEEILAVGASDRPVSFSDRQSLVYTEAVMAEIFRFATITPIAMPHVTTENTIFKGYNIPKGATICANIYSVHYDPTIWSDPKTFRPERFIEQDGSSLKFKANSALIQFSVGKRECMGATLAKDEFFLFLTNIIRNFSVSIPADEPPHSFEPIVSLVNSPEPHRIILTSR